MQTKLEIPLQDASYIVFDIETTGGNPAFNGITEIFAQRIVRGEIKDSFYSLVNPKVRIPPIVRRITGINQAMVKDAPLIEEVMPKFLDFIKQDILVSHNSFGDVKYLRHFAMSVCNNELDNFYLCTHLLSKLIPEAPIKSLSGLAEYLEILSDEKVHRARADAILTLKLFNVLCKKMLDQKINSVFAAIRLQGDLESNIRIGWSITKKHLNNLPEDPGLLKFYSNKDKLLFFCACESLQKEEKNF